MIDAPADEVIPTSEGADVARGCGCVERLDPDWDAWVLISLCRAHENLTAAMDRNLPRLTGPELDHYVAEACGQHRTTQPRLRPRDETKARR